MQCPQCHDHSRSMCGSGITLQYRKIEVSSGYSYTSQYTYWGGTGGPRTGTNYHSSKYTFARWYIADVAIKPGRALRCQKCLSALTTSAEIRFYCSRLLKRV